MSSMLIQSYKFRLIEFLLFERGFSNFFLKNYYVVLLSPFDLDPNLAIILQVPLWSQRVIYLQGSALNNSDLNRAQIEKAEACFILADRHNKDRYAADQHSILRSWAIKVNK